MSDQFIGVGWTFPVQTDATGGIAMSSREREIEEAIRLILGTALGERPMRPEFGCRVHEYVFAPASASIAGRMSAEVRESLMRWEPRIDVRDVTVRLDQDDPTVVYIDVSYSIRATNDRRNLVFPFYMIPSEGEPIPELMP